MDRKAWKYGFGIAFIIAGAVLNALGIGRPDFIPLGGLGNWMLYIGFISIAMTVLQSMGKKKRLVDERMLMVAAKANRIVFLAVVILAFGLMIVDGIVKITLPYHMFMSYLVAFMMAVYFVSYKVLLKYN